MGLKGRVMEVLLGRQFTRFQAFTSKEVKVHALELGKPGSLEEEKREILETALAR
ncbi:hypothetical protein SOVF_063990 [Spinacia oleracea]|nr:hypothetical protein SOVF_063990 [Spinacia oleracea]